jgi:CheY-like chemotaxis protein
LTSRLRLSHPDLGEKKMSQESVQSTGLLLSDDMLFTSRVTGTARSLGLTVKVARNVEIVHNLAKQQSPSCVIIDLANPGLNIRELIDKVRETCASMPRLIAYGSHVDATTLKAARDAGCDLVLPRSKFVEDLPNELATWMKVNPPSPNPSTSTPT